MKVRGQVHELVEALDHIFLSLSVRVDQPSLMPIEDVFSIAGRGTVVTGRLSAAS